MDTDKMNTSSFLMVLTEAGDYAYQNPDGVFVVFIEWLEVPIPFRGKKNGQYKK